MCNDRIEILAYEGNEVSLKLSLKHRQQIQDWLRPSSQAELDAFLWLTPFLRIFIPGWAAHVLALKEAYFEQVWASIKPKRLHDGDVEDCDQDYTKKIQRAKAKKRNCQESLCRKKGISLGTDTKGFI